MFYILGRALNHPLTSHWNLDSETIDSKETAEEIIKSITKELRATHQKTKQLYDKNRKPSPYQVGDLICTDSLCTAIKLRKSLTN